MLVLLLLTGIFAGWALVGRGSAVERTAYTLLFALTLAPALVTAGAFLRSAYVSRTGLLVAALLLLALLAKPALDGLRRRGLPRPDRRDAIVLSLAALVAAGAAVYYTQTEFWLSLGAYVQTGEAKCFYMQTFNLVEGLNVGPPGVEVPETYRIISTPGNVLFTAPMMHVHGTETFHVLYACFHLLLFLFTYLLLARIVDKAWIAGAVALFAVLNPYTLSIEVLDRNVMALALTTALLYTVIAHRRKAFLHGLLYGIAAGTGLRFLPLITIVPIVALYVRDGARLRAYAALLGGFVLAFAFNVPHLSFHGFHSLGEDLSIVRLASMAVSSPARTPFVPHVNAIYYTLNTMSHLGLVGCALVIVGAGVTLCRDRWLFAAMVLLLVVPLLVLSVQRDWIEGDKDRIFLSSLLPAAVFLAHGVAFLVTRRSASWLPRAAALLLAIACLVGVSHLLRLPDVPCDTGTYARKPIYQRETASFHAYHRDHFARVRLLPDYRRLFLKTDLGRKRTEARVVASTLFGGDRPTDLEDRPWMARVYGDGALRAPRQPSPSSRYVSLRIDLERLVARPVEAVEIVEDDVPAFVDLERGGSATAAYKECVVSWQRERLPVLAFADSPEARALNEIHIDLNAFAGYGRDATGHERVNVISLMTGEEQRRVGYATGMPVQPLHDGSSAVVVRMPDDARVVIRDWIVDGTAGVPHRIDSWSVAIDARGEPTLRFHVGEPESYL